MATIIDQSDEQLIMDVKTRVSPEWWEKLEDVRKKLGFPSRYEMMQALMAAIIPLSEGWWPMDEHRDTSLLSHLQGFRSCDGAKELVELLLSMREGERMANARRPVGRSDRIDSVIIEQRGGLFTQLRSPGLFAEYSHNIDNVVDSVLVDHDEDMRHLLDTIRPHYGGIESNRELIRAVLRDNIRIIMRTLEDAGGEVAQNTYGSVPKQVRNKTIR